MGEGYNRNYGGYERPDPRWWIPKPKSFKHNKARRERFHARQGR